jgi:hypothetical protein
MADSTKKTETREGNSWFSEAQLDRLAPAGGRRGVVGF